MQKLLVAGIVCLVLLALTGCGSDSDAKPPATAQTGYVIGGLASKRPDRVGPVQLTGNTAGGLTGQQPGSGGPLPAGSSSSLSRG
jgi:hypothetical protein